MIDLLKDILVLASFVGVLFAPFPFLDKYASPAAKVKAQKAIKEGQINTDTKPLASLLEKIFGPKHLTVRCVLLSALMSLIFTVLFLGMVNNYVLDLAAYVGNYDARINPAEEKLKEAMKLLIPAQDTLIEALRKSDDPESRRKLAELKLQRQRSQDLLDKGLSKGTYVLAWMILSVAIFLNIVCDYIALGKTRIILKRINAAQSSLAIGGYLVLDILLAAAIWTVLTLIFIVLNFKPFSAWLHETPDLVSVTCIVSLATTVATSIWIYTFLAGSFVSTFLRRFIGFLLRETTWVINPKDHTFKVIGIVGSIVMTILLMLVYLMTRLM